MLRVDKTDPETSLFGIPDGWSNRPLTLTAKATDGESGMLATGSGGPFTAIRIDGGSPITAPGDSVTATAIESGVHSIAYYARDAAGNVADGGKLNGHPNHEPEVAVVRIDREPPRLAFANSQDPGDPERIEARVDDSLSGSTRAAGRSRSAHSSRASASRQFQPRSTAASCVPTGTPAPTRPASTSSAPRRTTGPATRSPRRAAATARRCVSPPRSKS